MINRRCKGRASHYYVRPSRSKWFGGKSRVAPIVWERFGNPQNYCEPFFGSGAVLLNRPHSPKIETVNDKDCYIANFYRAIQNDPDHVAYYADLPINEADLHARHTWLVNEGRAILNKLKHDPDAYDCKIAGWWVWGICSWIGGGWCGEYGQKKDGTTKNQLPHLTGDRGINVQHRIPYLSGEGQGINRVANKRPNLGKGGKGINRTIPEKLPLLGGSGKGVNRIDVQSRTTRLHSDNGINRQRQDIYAYFYALAERLRHVRVCCGDWTRITGPAVTTCNGVTAVLLDPPYERDERDTNIYNQDDQGVAEAVREWAISNGNDPKLRIAVCGYESSKYQFPSDWEVFKWQANGGYANRTKKPIENRLRERIFFSPYCNKVDLPLFQNLING